MIMLKGNYTNKNILKRLYLNEDDFIFIKNKETKTIKLRFSILKNMGLYFKIFNIKEKKGCFYQFKIFPFSQLSKIIIDTKIINKTK